MAATEMIRKSASAGTPLPELHLFERRAGLGRKLLIAGSSGLNISHQIALPDFAKHYEGLTPDFWERILQAFGPKEWIQFIESELKMETFVGTSDRWFVKEMKASGLLKRWLEWLTARGVHLHSRHEWIGFHKSDQKIDLSFEGESNQLTYTGFDRVLLALGGGSWEEAPPRWPEILMNNNIQIEPFQSANAGYEVAWLPAFLKEAEGKPLKKVDLITNLGRKRGELVVTQYGLEGTPIYFMGTKGPAHLDLKPDLSEAEMLRKLGQIKENLSPMRRVKRALSLSEAAEALLFHHTPESIKKDLNQLVSRIKSFPLELLQARPLLEAISSRGGIVLSEIDEQFRLKKFPQIFCAGEMLAWHAPTGGFLIQACISQGAWVARNLV